MRTFARVLGPVFLLIGAALLAESLSTGGARLYLLLVIPVVTGTTPLFGLSVVFLVLGLLFLPSRVRRGGISREPALSRPVPGGEYRRPRREAPGG